MHSCADQALVCPRKRRTTYLIFTRSNHTQSQVDDDRPRLVQELQVSDEIKKTTKSFIQLLLKLLYRLFHSTKKIHVPWSVSFVSRGNRQPTKRLPMLYSSVGRTTNSYTLEFLTKKNYKVRKYVLLSFCHLYYCEPWQGICLK